MGTQINDIVVVNITREGPKITRAGFGTLLVVGSATFPEVVRTYGDVSEAQVDRDASLITPDMFKMISDAFSQEIKPKKVKAGKRTSNFVQVNRVTVDVVANNTQYDVTINGTTFSYTSDASASDVEISAGLTQQINLGSEPVTATDGGDGTLDIDSDSVYTPYTITVGDGLSETSLQEMVNIVTNISDVEQADSDWYELNIEHNANNNLYEQEILNVAQWIEARRKVFSFSSQDPNCIEAVSTDILSQIQALAYDRTFGMYHQNANTEYPESSWAGRCLPEDAGSITWKFKQLAGITPTSLKGTQLTNLKNKNANFYERVGGVNIISSQAVVASGEYIDVIRGTDWLQAQIEEKTFTLLTDAPKVPFTNDGITMVAGPLRDALDQAVTRGFLASSEVFQPDISAIPVADRANRCLDKLEFEGILAGAIHKVKVKGTLSVA